MATQQQQNDFARSVGAPAPSTVYDFELNSIEELRYIRRTTPGMPMLVFVYNDHCKMCADLAPQLSAIVGARYIGKLNFVKLNTFNSQVWPLMRELGIGAPPALPYVVYIDPQGKPRDYFVGNESTGLFGLGRRKFHYSQDVMFFLSKNYNPLFFNHVNNPQYALPSKAF